MMKTFILFALLLTLGTSAARGQAALLVLIFGEKVATENFYFSLKGGLNYSMVTEYEEGQDRIGINFGLVNNIRLSEHLYLTPEFLPLSPRGIMNVPVVTTGVPELDSLLVNPESTDRKLSYIDIPVLLQYRVTDRWSISAGPQFSWLTGASDIYHSSPGEDMSLTTELDVRDQMKRYDLGFAIDLSYMVSKPHGGKGLNLFIRYSRGFVNIYPNDEGRKFYNSTLQFGATFPFVENDEPKKE